MSSENDEVSYKGYRFRWTGWKNSQGNVILIGQWVCLTKSGRLLFSGSNGIVGVYGSVESELPIYSRDLKQITILSSEPEKEERRQLTLSALMAMIDNHGSSEEDYALTSPV